MTNTPDDPWSPLNEDFETPEYDDDTARPQFGTYANTSLTPEYAKALIEKYGHTELHSTVDEDMDDFGPGPTMEQLEEENRAMQEVPDDELDDLDYYGRHGFSRTAPTCDDPDCHMCD